MVINASKLFELLTLGEHAILGEECKITLTLKGIAIGLTDKNIVGNVIQVWLSEFFKQSGIEFDISPNSQEYPDFFLDPSDHTKGLLEIKAFDMDASANFDVANFESYCSSLRTDPYRLDADYLIFGYAVTDSKILIKQIWLKKIWEITGPSAEYPIRVQQKRKMIYNIRPINWSSLNRVSFKPFANKVEFVEALHKTLLKYEKTLKDSEEWMTAVQSNYLQQTGKEIAA